MRYSRRDHMSATFVSGKINETSKDIKYDLHIIETHIGPIRTFVKVQKHSGTNSLHSCTCLRVLI